MTHTSATISDRSLPAVSRIPSKRPSAQPQKRPQPTTPRPPLAPPAATTQSPPRRLARPSRSSYVATSATNLPSPRQPATRNAKKPSQIATLGEPSARLSTGLLTSGSFHSRASSTSQESPAPNPATPSAPNKKRQKADDGPVSDSKSLFMEAHVGDHCIKGALVHKLACGHKVMTVKVEACAGNCVRPLLKHLQDHANQATEEAFVCAACIEQHVQAHREAKRALFEQTFEATEQKMVAFPHGWLDKQRLYWEKVWENDIVMEQDAFALLGRKCAHFGGHVMVTHVKKEESVNSAVPFPPKRRPKPSRAFDKEMLDSLHGSKAEHLERRDSKRDSILE